MKVVTPVAVGENQAVIRIMINVTRGKIMEVVVMAEIMLVMIEVKILVIEAEAILRVKLW